MSQKQEDLYAQERAMPLKDFVEKLFETARDAKRSGLFMERDDGHITHIEILLRENRVEVKMDGVVMGHFEEYAEQGYKTAFHQQHRVGMRDGLTKNEALMKAFCGHPLVRFIDA